MSSLLDKISELEQQIVELKAEVEKEEKEKDPNKRWRAEEGNIYWFVVGVGICDWRLPRMRPYGRQQRTLLLQLWAAA